MKHSLYTLFFVVCVFPSTSCAQRSIYDSLWKAEEYFADPQLVALCKAIEKEDLEKIDQLVAEGADVNARGKDGMTALLWAYPMGEKVLERILEHGADPNTQYDNSFGTRQAEIVNGDSLLFIAIKSSSLGNTYNREKFQNYIDILLKHGADPNLLHARHNMPPLSEAVTHHSPEAVEKLIKAGADIDFKNDIGEPLISQAAGVGAHSVKPYVILRLLIEHGADYRVIDNSNGLTFAHILGRDYWLMGSDTEAGEQYREIAAWMETRGMSLERAKEQRELWQKTPMHNGDPDGNLQKYIKEVVELEIARWLPPGVEPLELPEAVHRPNMQDNNVRVVVPNHIPPPPQNNAWDVTTIAILIVLLLFMIGIALLFLYLYEKKKQ